MSKMRKPILCRLGFHKPDPVNYIKVYKSHRNGKTYTRNYTVCRRCGKRLDKFGLKKRSEPDPAEKKEGE